MTFVNILASYSNYYTFIEMKKQYFPKWKIFTLYSNNCTRLNVFLLLIENKCYESHTYPHFRNKTLFTTLTLYLIGFYYGAHIISTTSVFVRM